MSSRAERWPDKGHTRGNERGHGSDKERNKKENATVWYNVMEEREEG